MRLQLLSEGYLCCHLKTENIVFILKSNYFLKKFTSQKKKKKSLHPSEDYLSLQSHSLQLQYHFMALALVKMKSESFYCDTSQFSSEML